MTTGNPLTGTEFLGSTTGPFPLVIKTTPAQPINFFTNSTQRMTITSYGWVGIGTTSPNTTLDVYGNIGILGSVFVSSSGAIAKGNTFLGMTGNTTNTGTSNTFLGYKGGYLNTTGNVNIAIGENHYKQNVKDMNAYAAVSTSLKYGSANKINTKEIYL